MIKVPFSGSVALVWLLPIMGLMTSCGSTRQSQNFGSSDLATPSHSMPHEEYPYDDGGRYVDEWAREGASKYQSATDSDRDDRPVRRTVAASKPKPKASSKTKATASKSKTKPTIKSKAAPVKSRSTSVIVKKGDTLYGLARRFKTTVTAIKAANGMSSDALKDGRKLTIPLK